MYTSPIGRTQQLYEQHAHEWVRREPTILSDFTARPRVLEKLGNVAGLDVLDLGCGEGYLSRQLAEAGAHRVVGIDLSTSMIQAAKEQNASDHHPIEYHAADLRSWTLQPKSFDRAIAVFLFNYLKLRESVSILAKCRESLKKNGQLILTLPHPSLPWLRGREAPFYFDQPSIPYQAARDVELSGRIWQRSGNSVPVQCFHKTVTDVFEMLDEAGFGPILSFEELYVTEKHISLDPSFFAPLRGTPLHILIQAEA